ncbi:MAG: hypothetical protein M3X11_05490 [Acidobacteriota bacterium]|nr:hypothetical protein [Acidobacteriota bacterium]
MKEIERKVDDMKDAMSHMRGEVDVIKHNSRDLARQTIWQFIAFAVAMGVIAIGGIRYQAEILRNEMNIRFQAQRQESNARLDAIEKHIEQSEKNIIARFDDLKQEVRANRK